MSLSIPFRRIAPQLTKLYQPSLTSIATRSLSSAARHLPAVPFKTHVGQGPVAHTFFHNSTWTWQYVVADPATSKAVLIDPVLDFDPVSNQASTETADSILSFITSRGYDITRILETHAHADHLTASQYFKRKLGGAVPVGIGEEIVKVQNTFGKVYGFSEEEMKGMEGAFDTLWKDGDVFEMGSLEWEVMHLPGHTPDHVGYQCGDFVFVGDSLFLPDVGSARADFPGGSVSSLFASSQRLLALPKIFRVFSGHDYPDESRSYNCSSTVGEQKAANKHLKDGTSAEEFQEMRTARDSGLAAPKLLHQSLQVNIRAGHLPKTDEKGALVFKVPQPKPTPA